MSKLSSGARIIANAKVTNILSSTKHSPTNVYNFFMSSLQACLTPDDNESFLILHIVKRLNLLS